MEQEPEVVERSPRLPPRTVTRAADQNLPIHETSRSARGSPALLPIPSPSVKLPQINPDPREHGSRVGTPMLSAPDHTNEVENWHQKYLQRRDELLAEREKANRLEAAERTFSSEAIAWQARFSESEEGLAKEREAHNRTHLKLQQRQQDVQKFIGLLNDANDKLGSAINPNQVRHQLEDAAITLRAKRLRLSIRTFAEQFGEVHPSDHPNLKKSYSLFKRYLYASEDTLATYIESPSARPKILRPFLWTFLYEEVFDKFFWAPPDIRSALRTLRDLIEPSQEDLSDEETEVERKQITWRADTTNMVLERLNENTHKTRDSQHNFVSAKAQKLVGLLEPIVCRDKRTLYDPLVKLLNESLELDLVLSQQVAIWSWEFPKKLPCQFDKEVHTTIQKRHHGQIYEIKLVLAPALMKRGKSSGDDFLDQYAQVKMEVEIDTPRQDNSGSQSFRKKVFDKLRPKS
ncbi:hypothetical protein N7536_009275 [Penicillium majusculum]|uniref:Uncharacterized protein n=1 Tax=Penicillium solitum TaxID=60172 RepID=A0A1V6R3U2_9EURO|nr:uncharacterized protein PENSOL_c018G09432 [Penicillium solitum]KAJ5686656.1 hypothetical protein N7536_009275 [Penicillium majusculum]OQD95872.1 hypothetical protein PENSOL_c018G09432 [Penicillium solitum]